MASLAQLEANRANAKRSTGPKTPEGKDASRRNAIRHGLASETLILPEEEAAAVAARVVAWTPALRPVGEYDAWLVEEVALSSVRIDRCRDHEIALRSRAARRAALCWDLDRRDLAEELGAKLGKKPSIVARKLRDQAGLRLADRALGAPRPGVGIRKRLGRGAEEAGNGPARHARRVPQGPRRPGRRPRGAGPAQLAEIAALKADAMEELDAMERAAAEVGLGDESDRALRLVRRYEAACVRRFERARKQIGKGRPAPAPAKAVPAPAPRPFDPPPPECGFADDDEAEAFLRMVEEMEREGEDVEAILERMPASPAPVPVASPKPVAPVGNRRSRRALKAMARRG